MIFLAASKTTPYFSF